MFQYTPTGCLFERQKLVGKHRVSTRSSDTPIALIPVAVDPATGLVRGGTVSCEASLRPSVLPQRRAAARPRAIALEGILRFDLPLGACTRLGGQGRLLYRLIKRS